MRKFIIILVGLYTLSALIFINCAGKKPPFWGSAKDGYILIYKQDKGVKFDMNYATEMEQILDIMGNEQKSVSKSNTDFLLYVKSVDMNGSIDLELEYKGFSNNIDAMGNITTADFSDVIGKKVGLNLSSKGTTSAFEGFENLPVINILQNQDFGEEQYIFQVRYLFPPLPEKPVKIGSPWNTVQKFNVPMQGGQISLVSNTTYKLVEATKKDGIDCLKIEGISKIAGKGEGDSPQGPFIFEGEGEGSEIIYFAYKKGMILSHEMKTEFEGNINISNFSIPLIQTIKEIKTVTF